MSFSTSSSELHKGYAKGRRSAFEFVVTLAGQPVDEGNQAERER
jgi:hypothetical protein